MSETDNDSIHSEYIRYANILSNDYGNNSIVLLQVGAFFEVYGIKIKDEYVRGENIVEFANICGLNISEKTGYANKSIMMAGFRDFMVDKYLTKLTENGYTVAVYIQKKNGKQITRELDHIYSPGTYMSCETDTNTRLSNNIMCIWLEVFTPYSKANKKNTLVSGASVINIFTGDVYTFQTEVLYYMNITTFDELERFVSMYSPSEVIIINNFNKDDYSKLINYTGITTTNIHNVELNSTKCERCKNQKFIKEIISNTYNEEAYDVCKDFTDYILATQSLCYLLNFIQEHNSDIIKKIKLPIFNNVSENVILANHTLAQLNIISSGDNGQSITGKKSSVMSLLNNCTTAMGKRKIQYQLTHPTTNIEWLKEEYNMIHIFKSKFVYSRALEWRKELSKIRDVDKMLRQILLKLLYPSSMYNLYDMVLQVEKIINSDKKPTDYINGYITNTDEKMGSKTLTKITGNIKRFLNKKLKIKDCKTLNSMTVFPTNIIKQGVNEELDQVSDKLDDLYGVLIKIRDGINKFFQSNSSVPVPADFIKLHQTEKSGYSLQLTAKRSDLLLKIIKEEKIEEIELDGIIIKTNSIKIMKASASNVDINMHVDTVDKDIHTICRSILNYKNKLNELISTTYIEILNDIEEEIFKDIEKASRCIERLDVIISKAYTAKEYKYCCPEIQENEGSSFFDASGLRHCLIEQLQTNEIYVDNDISLGRDNEKGNLLYGTNAVGKTSLIRAIGITLIMAQSGMYVPCSKFVYKPYSAIFSRILGNDNLFKGLSTFAVEMSELRTILNLADENSLVLGDELCSGTESESALSIFVAGLNHLHEKKSSFIFATHFHEIVDYDEIKGMICLKLKHLEVSYDAENECLVYDRKLKEGSGPRIYGLEVCKSLFMSPDFLEEAFKIRNKYFKTNQGILNYNETKYNASKIRGICEMCKNEVGTEIHHLQQQKEADDDGFIGNFHKNHKANLISICEDCHNSIHHDKDKPTVSKKKKTTKGMKLY